MSIQHGHANAEVVIRTLTGDDRVAAARIFSENGLCESAGLTDRLDISIRGGGEFCLAADRQEQCVGILLAHYNGFHLFLSHVAVAKDYQGQGIGTQLHEELFRRAKERGACGILVDSWLSSVGFYWRLGCRVPGAVYLMKDLP